MGAYARSIPVTRHRSCCLCLTPQIVRAMGWVGKVGGDVFLPTQKSKLDSLGALAYE